MSSKDMEVWDAFFSDPRFVALVDGWTVINHPDGTWTKERR